MEDAARGGVDGKLGAMLAALLVFGCGLFSLWVSAFVLKIIFTATASKSTAKPNTPYRVEDAPPIANPSETRAILPSQKEDDNANKPNVALNVVVGLASWIMVTITFGGAIFVIAPVGLFLWFTADHKRLKSAATWLLIPCLQIPLYILGLGLEHLLEAVRDAIQRGL